MTWEDWYNKLVGSMDPGASVSEFDKTKTGIFTDQGVACYTPATFKVPAASIKNIVELIKSGNPGQSVKLGMAADGDKGDKFLGVNFPAKDTVLFMNPVCAMVAHKTGSIVILATAKVKDNARSLVGPVTKIGAQLSG